jgi:hypothetical protein
MINLWLLKGLAVMAGVIIVIAILLVGFVAIQNAFARGAAPIVENNTLYMPPLPAAFVCWILGGIVLGRFIWKPSK